MLKVFFYSAHALCYHGYRAICKHAYYQITCIGLHLLNNSALQRQVAVIVVPEDTRR